MKEPNLHMVAYISKRKTSGLSKANVEQQIVRTAKLENPKHGISGVLFHHNDVFLQVIEGQKKHIDQLMRNIQADDRHYDLNILVDEPVEKRGFEGWNMDYFDLSSQESINYSMLVDLAKEYKDNLLPRADVFVSFYKAILSSIKEKQAC